MLKKAIGIFFLLGLLISSTTQAATINTLHLNCSFALLGGEVEVNAPYVRIQVVNAANLSVTIGETVTPVWWGGGYFGFVSYPPQPAGSLLIISVGEWDGTQYVQPAHLTSVHCSRPTPTATWIPSRTPTPLPVTPSATWIPSRTPTQPPVTPSATWIPSRTPTPLPVTPSATWIPSRTPTQPPVTPSATWIPSRTPTPLPVTPSATWIP